MTTAAPMQLFRNTEKQVRRALGAEHGHIHPDIPDGSKILIHIGKSGGSSLRAALKQTSLGGEVISVHIRRPPVRPTLEYYIVARGPISRALSAFNWRYKRVVTDGDQRHRLPGEYDLLTKYQTLNALALDLYDSTGAPNPDAIAGFSRMHHIRENIAFYLLPLLDRVDPRQIKAVLMQESLDADIERVLGVAPKLREKQHGASLDPERKHLDPEARDNLRRFFAADYGCLNRLYCWGLIAPDVYLKTL